MCLPMMRGTLSSICVKEIDCIMVWRIAERVCYRYWIDKICPVFDIVFMQLTNKCPVTDPPKIVVGPDVLNL